MTMGGKNESEEKEGTFPSQVVEGNGQTRERVTKAARVQTTGKQLMNE